MSFIRQGIKATIRGKDIGNQLNFIIKKSKTKNIKDFLKWLEKWKDEEVQKLIDKKFNTENLIDRYECLVNLCDEASSLEQVSKNIKELFNDSDENNYVQLSTIHRAKGLQNKNVFILNWTLRVHIEDDAVQSLEHPNEEGNLSYIAFSRSLENVFIVHKF
jgi:superfamily I DNA/RNA helicase